MIMRSTISCFIVCTAAFLSACSTGPLSGAAAMRIEVEVYKGPLSLEPEIQLGELRGYLAEAYRSLLDTNSYILNVAGTKYVSMSPSNETDIKTREWCKEIETPGFLTPGFWVRSGHFDCSLLKSISLDTFSLLKKLQFALDSFENTKPTTETRPASDDQPEFSDKLSDYQAQNQKYSSKIYGYRYFLEGTPNDIQSRMRNILAQANVAAASMQSAAFRYATAQTPGQSLNFYVRIATANFIVTASEYSNQISSRVDALMKQFGEGGRDRRELPLSVHLREAEPTDFVHLYNWMDATSNSFLNYFIVGTGTIDERIKIVDRLYADHFWSKINTVHASGRGKTQMAFVKDETGNWNLKSFDNDPSELLDGYTNVAKTALDGVVKVATRMAANGASGGGAEVAQQLLALADQTALAKTAQPAQSKGMLSLDYLRDRIAGQLNSVQIQGDLAKEDDLVKKISSTKTVLETATKAGKTSEADQARSELEKATADLLRHRKNAISRWAVLVDDHSSLVDMLASTIKKK